MKKFIVLMLISVAISVLSSSIDNQCYARGHPIDQQINISINNSTQPIIMSFKSRKALIDRELYLYKEQQIVDIRNSLAAQRQTAYEQIADLRRESAVLNASVDLMRKEREILDIQRTEIRGERNGQQMIIDSLKLEISSLKSIISKLIDQGRPEVTVVPQQTYYNRKE